MPSLQIHSHLLLWPTCMYRLKGIRLTYPGLTSVLAGNDSPQLGVAALNLAPGEGINTVIVQNSRYHAYSRGQLCLLT